MLYQIINLLALSKTVGLNLNLLRNLSLGGGHWSITYSLEECREWRQFAVQE